MNAKKGLSKHSRKIFDNATPMRESVLRSVEKIRHEIMDSNRLTVEMEDSRF